MSSSIDSVAREVYARILKEVLGNRGDWMGMDVVRIYTDKVCAGTTAKLEPESVISYLTRMDVVIGSWTYSDGRSTMLYVARTAYEIANGIYREPV